MNPDECDMNPYEKYEKDRHDTVIDAIENEVVDEPLSDSDSIPISFASILLENHALEPNPVLVFECLNYSLETGEPLPPFLIGELVYHMDLLRKGWESVLFEKAETKHKKHPLAETIERSAVDYIESGLKSKNDTTPVKTICDRLKVSSTSVYRWRDKYKDFSDDLNKLQMRLFLDHLAPHYSRVRYK